MSKFSNPLLKTTDDIKGQLNQLEEKNKVFLIGFEKRITLIDYNTSRNKKALNAKQLSEEIKALDKKGVEQLAAKCQRLYLFSKHKLYEDLGYVNLDEFALNEHGISRMQLFKYVLIFERLEKNLLAVFQDVKSTLHLEDLSVEKLYLVAKIEEENKINEWFDKITQENVSVSELKKELKDNKLIIEKKDKKFTTDIDMLLKLFRKKLPRKLTNIDKIKLKELAEEILDIIK